MLLVTLKVRLDIITNVAFAPTSKVLKKTFEKNIYLPKSKPTYWVSYVDLPIISLNTLMFLLELGF